MQKTLTEVETTCNVPRHGDIAIIVLILSFFILFMIYKSCSAIFKLLNLFLNNKK
ncbi:MAG: hypothetical protein GY739_19345 [Mesoflavibacter sp.]|nr:hypothetical protein [Mesoflavibacter sp.]